ncbi:MAG TPA: GNAT family N-acetyltransferase, partial [Anaerolineales bacterium]|nr:GNAT family N-acetyltransferase [Anaerolineales bacterium]
MTMQSQSIPLVPASKFSMDELAAFFNETRADYLVPMPMSSVRMEEYIRDYDVDLKRSVIAMRAGRVMGLGMMGLRDQKAWITRLGVMPLVRRRGIGEAMVASLMNTARFLDVEKIYAEVIIGNHAAHALLQKHGFVDGKEYLILRRPPSQIIDSPNGKARWLEKEEALSYLQEAKGESW